MRALSFALVVAVGSLGCKQSSPSPQSSVSPTAAASEQPGRYGAPVSAGAAQPIASVLAAADANAGKTVLVEGKVRANCTRKGCWMELASGMEKEQPGCRVTFKDYGFFVPINSQGASARVEGVLAVRTIPADEVAHLEGEGGSFPGKQADGSAREVRIVASGVELKK